MSDKLSRLRLAKVNSIHVFVAERRRADGALKTLNEVRKEFERYERLMVDEILPVAFTDRHESGKTFGEILENKEFELSDLPFQL